MPQCNWQPEHLRGSNYGPCTRPANHDGPCRHPLRVAPEVRTAWLQGFAAGAFATLGLTIVWLAIQFLKGTF